MKPYTITVYQSRDGWRWRMRAGNNRIVADSGEAYSSQRAAYRAASAISDRLIVVQYGRASKEWR